MNAHDMYILCLILHAISGGVALISGIIPMVARKGGRMHKSVGKVYVFSMYTSIAFATLITIIRPNLFLLLIGVFSFYLTFTGNRSPRFKRVVKDSFPLLLDRMVSIGMILGGLIMIIISIRSAIIGHFNPILLVFGLIGCTLALSDIRWYTRLRTGSSDRHSWMFQHLARMIAAYIATLTAFLVVNYNNLFPELPREFSLIPWFGPTVIGSISIAMWTRYYRNRLRS